jgi:hypothetical protein
VRCEQHGVFEGLCGGIIFRKYLRQFLFYWERIKTPFVMFSHLWRKSLTRVTSSWFGNFHFTKKVVQILDLFDLYWRMKWKKILLCQIWGLIPYDQHTRLSLTLLCPSHIYYPNWSSVSASLEARYFMHNLCPLWEVPPIDVFGIFHTSPSVKCHLLFQDSLESAVLWKFEKHSHS